MALEFQTAHAPNGQPLAVIPLKGRFDAKTVAEIRQQVQQVIDQGLVNLLLDLKEVTFMDSSGLGTLISLLRQCRSKGGNVCLCRVPEVVQIVLDLTSMDRVLSSFPTPEAGIENFVIWR
ncbi:MAG: STAS domain-containing protein [Thermostichales cyanobacterium GMQP_bins_62]